MTTEINVKVNPKFVGRFQKGFPLISKEAITNADTLTDEGSIIHLVDQRKQFIAKGYYGKQNKGLGWVLTRKQGEQIDFDFFRGKIEAALNKRKSFYTDSNTNAFRIFNGEGDGIAMLSG